MAQGETIAAATSAGTSAAISLKRFGHFNGTIKRDGVALGNIVSADVTYANNLDRIETIRSDARIDGADPTIAALTGKIDVRFADTTLMIQAINGSAATLEFSYAFSSGESLTLTAHAVYLPRPRIEIKGPKGVQASFDWQAALATSPARMSGWSLDATTGTVTFTTPPAMASSSGPGSSSMCRCALIPTCSTSPLISSGWGRSHPSPFWRSGDENSLARAAGTPD